jgi:TonB family protein
MTEQGNIALAGPFPLSVPGELRGVVIYRVGEEHAAKLAQEDPVVKMGILRAELHPWATGKGVLASGQVLQALSAEPPKRIAVGGNVAAARLINRVSPVYPEEASRENISGTVKLHVVIAKDGKVQQIQVVSGHPLLVQAAIDAVRQWQYQPTLLNGQPVEVDTQIDVVFSR